MFQIYSIECYIFYPNFWKWESSCFLVILCRVNNWLSIYSAKKVNCYDKKKVYEIACQILKKWKKYKNCKFNKIRQPVKEMRRIIILLIMKLGVKL